MLIMAHRVSVAAQGSRFMIDNRVLQTGVVAFRNVDDLFQL